MVTLAESCFAPRVAVAETVMLSGGASCRFGSGEESETGISLPVGVSVGLPTSSHSAEVGCEKVIDFFAAVRSTFGSALASAEGRELGGHHHGVATGGLERCAGGHHGERELTRALGHELDARLRATALCRGGHGERCAGAGLAVLPHLHDKRRRPARG